MPRPTLAEQDWQQVAEWIQSAVNLLAPILEDAAAERHAREIDLGSLGRVSLCNKRLQDVLRYAEQHGAKTRPA